MGMLGNGSGVYIHDGDQPFNGPGGSITGWFLRSDTTLGTVASVSQSTNANAWVGLNARSALTESALALTDNAGAAVTVSPGTTSDRTGKWTFAAACFDSSSARRGIGRPWGSVPTSVSDATAATLASFNRFAVGCRRVNTTISQQVPASMIIGSVCFWARALSFQECIALSSGVHPFDVAPGQCIYLFEMKTAPICARTGLVLTLSGTQPAFLPTQNPPVRDRRQPRRALKKLSAAAGFHARHYYELIGRRQNV